MYPENDRDKLIQEKLHILKPITGKLEQLLQTSSLAPFLDQWNINREGRVLQQARHLWFRYIDFQKEHKTFYSPGGMNHEDLITMIYLATRGMAHENDIIYLLMERAK